MPEDIVIPGQFTDLSKKPQLHSLNEVVRDLADAVSTNISTTTIITSSVAAQVVISKIEYPFL